MPYRASDIEQAVEIAVKVFNRLGTVIRAYTGAEPRVGGSYGWCAPSEDSEVCLDLIQKAIDDCGYTEQCAFALDCAMTEMYDREHKTYYLNGSQVTNDELVAYVKRLTEKYNFVFIEDMLDEDDWDGFVKAHREITRTYIIADDLTVSNPARIRRAYELKAIDGLHPQAKPGRHDHRGARGAQVRQRARHVLRHVRPQRRRRGRRGHGSGGGPADPSLSKTAARAAASASTSSTSSCA